MTDTSMIWNDLAHGHVSASYAKATRFVGGGRKTSFLIDAEVTEVLIRLTSNKTRCGSTDGDLTVSFPEGTVYVKSGRRLFRALTGIDYETNASPNLREWLSSAIIASLRDTPFHKAIAIDVDSDTRFVDPLTLHITISTNKHTIPTVASANSDTWLTLFESASWKRDPMMPASVSTLPIDIPVPLATHRITAADLGRIHVGDVIIPDAPRFHVTGEGVLMIGDMRLNIEYQFPNGLLITDIHS